MQKPFNRLPLEQLSLLLMSVVVLVIYLTLNTKHAFVSINSDSAIYLLLATFYSPFQSGTEHLHEYLMQEYPFPPLFPAVLGFFGGGIHSPLSSYLQIAATLYLALIAAYLWNRSLGLSRQHAGLLVFLFALLPGTLTHLLLILSEHLYLLLILSGMLVFHRGQSRRHLLVTALLFGLAATTRTIGFVAVFALSLVLLGNREIRKSAIFGLVGLAPLLIWSLYKSRYSSGGDYLNIFFNTMQGDLLQALYDQIRANLQIYWLYLLRYFSGGFSIHVHWAMTCLVGLMGIGLLLRLRRFQLDALYVLGYLGILVLWPYPAQAERFLFAIMPFLLGYGLLGMTAVCGWICRSEKLGNGSSLAYLAVIFLLMSPALSGMWSRFHHPHVANSPDAARTSTWLESGNIEQYERSQGVVDKYYALMKEAGERVPEGDCIFSTIPEHTMLFSNHQSLHTPRPYLDDEAFEEGMKACDYVLMGKIQTNPAGSYEAMYPFHRIKHGMEVMAVYFVDPNSSSNVVAAMLAKYPRRENDAL